MRKTLPEKGEGWPDLEAELDAMTTGDIDWRGGRAPLYVFHATDSVAEVGRGAFNKFFTENALGRHRAFFSLGRMEREVVEIGLGLLNAPEDAAGHMTTGGSESIFLAVQAARDAWRDETGDPRARGNIVMPYSGHPTFDKAAHAMDLEVRRVPTAPDRRADVDAMASAVDGETFLLVGSAPCFPHGVIDPIAGLSELAQSRGIWLHVDACVGGYLAPFARQIGRPIPDFDFALTGVRSISADLHKYGFAPKPASTLFYRYKTDFERAIFAFEDWPNGRYAVSTVVGTRPGGGVAGSWAVLHHLGGEGYRAIAARLLTMADGYVAGIEAIDGMAMIARPDLTIINFAPTAGTASGLDALGIAREMEARGWLPGMTRDPAGLHAMLSLFHEPARERYLEDLRVSVATRAASATRDPEPVRAVY